MGFLTWLCGRAREEIVPGSIWRFKPDKEDPWEPSTWRVRVLDCKRDWVRYSMGGHSDERRTRESFLRLYEPIED